MKKNHIILDTRDCFMTDEELREQIVDSGMPEDQITEQTLSDEREFMIATDVENFWWEIRRIQEDSEPYYIEAELGLWYGVRQAHAIQSTIDKALRQCVDGMDDYMIEETPQGKLLVTGYHHDGTNHYVIHRGHTRSKLKNVHLRKLLGWI